MTSPSDKITEVANFLANRQNAAIYTGAGLSLLGRIPVTGVLRHCVKISEFLLRVHQYIYRPPVVDENLNFISRWGVRWWSLCLFQYFLGSFLKRDFFAHLRVDKVALGVLKYLQENPGKDSDKAFRIKCVERSILNQLDKKTKDKYHSQIVRVRNEFKKLFPEPTLTRPEEPSSVRSHENVQKIVWPPQLTPLGVDEADVAKIEKVFHEAIEKINALKNSKSTLKEKQIFPEKSFSLRFLYDENFSLQHVLLITGKEFRKERERKVCLCYDLITGKYFTHKDIPRKEERKLWEEIKKQKLRGLYTLCAFYKRSPEGFPLQWEIIERCPGGALPILFETAPLVKPEQQHSLIGDILSALAFVHLQEKMVEIEGEEISAPLFHGYISPANIFVEQRKEGHWAARVSNFGYVGNFASSAAPPGFNSPEYAHFLSKYPSAKEIIRFNLKNAQKKDAWAAALTLLTIVCGEKAKGPPIIKGFEGSTADISAMNIPPLPHLENCLRGGAIPFLERNLNEEQFFKNLKSLREEHSHIDPRIWEIIEGMLQFNLEQRLSIRKAFEKFSHVERAQK